MKVVIKELESSSVGWIDLALTDSCEENNDEWG
jgi:hypothetical protein